jgi:hypothetical protein
MSPTPEDTSQERLPAVERSWAMAAPAVATEGQRGECNLGQLFHWEYRFGAGNRTRADSASMSTTAGGDCTIPRKAKRHSSRHSHANCDRAVASQLEAA